MLTTDHHPLPDLQHHDTNIIAAAVQGDDIAAAEISLIHFLPLDYGINRPKLVAHLGGLFIFEFVGEGSHFGSQQIGYFFGFSR